MRTLVLLAILVGASALDIKVVQQCTDVDNSTCTIHAVRVEPCESDTKCTIRRKSNAKISFDFTPNFSTSNLNTSAVYKTIPWPDLSTNGCDFTTCPTVAGTMQTYTAEMHIGKLIPKAMYSVDWSVTDANDIANKCCFNVNFKIK